MIYEVISQSIFGGTMTWTFSDKHEAMCKVRELRDYGDMFLVKVKELEATE
jgi:hypothetical protein